MSLPRARALVLICGFVASCVQAADDFSDAHAIIAGLFPKITVSAAWGGTMVSADVATKNFYGGALRSMFQYIARSPQAQQALVFKGPAHGGRFAKTRLHFLFTDAPVFEYRIPDDPKVYARTPDRGLPTNNYAFHRPQVIEMNLTVGVWLNHMFLQRGQPGFHPHAFVRGLHSLSGALFGYTELRLREGVEVFALDFPQTDPGRSATFAAEEERKFLEWLKLQEKIAAAPDQVAYIDRLLHVLGGGADPDMLFLGGEGHHYPSPCARDVSQN